MHRLIRCNNPAVHQGRDNFPGEGNILCFIKDNKIIIQCNNHHCYGWTEISFMLPAGVSLEESAKVQRFIGNDKRFDCKREPIIIEDVNSL